MQYKAIEMTVRKTPGGEVVADGPSPLVTHMEERPLIPALPVAPNVPAKLQTRGTAHRSPDYPEEAFYLAERPLDAPDGGFRADLGVAGLGPADVTE